MFLNFHEMFLLSDCVEGPVVYTIYNDLEKPRREVNFIIQNAHLDAS